MRTCNAGPLAKGNDAIAVSIHHLLIVNQTNLLRKQKPPEFKLLG